jgi:hypothetical protein
MTDAQGHTFDRPAAIARNRAAFLRIVAVRFRRGVGSIMKLPARAKPHSPDVADKSFCQHRYRSIAK